MAYQLTVNGRSYTFGFIKTERKEAVLSELLQGSWMKDAGWSDEQIAAHYKADRDHRAAVIRERRRK